VTLTYFTYLFLPSFVKIRRAAEVTKTMRGILDRKKGWCHRRSQYEARGGNMPPPLAIASLLKTIKVNNTNDKLCFEFDTIFFRQIQLKYNAKIMHFEVK